MPDLSGLGRGMEAWPRCAYDSGDSYWGGCEAPARFRVERSGEGYSPAEVCPVHVAETMAYMVDGDDVPLTVHVLLGEPSAALGARAKR